MSDPADSITALAKFIVFRLRDIGIVVTLVLSLLCHFGVIEDAARNVGCIVVCVTMLAAMACVGWKAVRMIERS